MTHYSRYPFAHRVAETLGLCLTGTLGLLLDAKQAELLPAIAPILDQRYNLRLYPALDTTAAVLKLARVTLKNTRSESKLRGLLATAGVWCLVCLAFNLKHMHTLYQRTGMI